MRTGWRGQVRNPGKRVAFHARRIGPRSTGSGRAGPGQGGLQRGQ